MLIGIIDKVAPSRGRGLKLGITVGVAGAAGRPFTGAWIETFPWRQYPPVPPVAPSRGRGLKPPPPPVPPSPLPSPLHGGVD